MSRRASAFQKQLTLVLGLLTVIFVVVSVPDEIRVGLVVLLGGLALTLGLGQTDRRVALPLLIAYGVRVALILVHYYVYPLPGSGADAVRFERVGWQRAQDGFVATFRYLRLGSGVYYWLISAVYSVVGRSPLTILGINVVLGTLVVWNLSRAADRLWGRKGAVRAAWAGALFPNFVLYSAVILREMPIAYFFTLAVRYLIDWAKHERVRSLIAAIVCLGLSASFHEGLFAAIPILGLYAIWQSVRTAIRRRGKAPARVVWVPIMVLVLVLSFLGTSWGGAVVQEYMGRARIEDLETRQTTTLESRASYPAFLTIHGPLDILVKGPIRVLYFLFAPFPWMVRTILDLLGMLDSILYVYMSLVIWKNRRVLLGSRDSRILLLAFLAVLFVYSISVSNYGTAIRHRAKLASIPIVLAVGLQSRSVGSRAVRKGYAENAWYGQVSSY